VVAGLARLKAGDHEGAAKILRRVARNNPTEADAHHLYGVALHARGLTAEALPHVERAIRLNPAPSQYRMNHGLMLQKLGRAEEARQAFEDATDRDRENPECWHNWGTSLMGVSRWEDAELALKHAISLRSNYALSHFNLGCVYLTWGEVSAAARRFALALEHDPNFEKAHANLIFCRDLLPETTPGMALAERRAYQTRHAARLRPWQPHPNDRNPERRLRVGYVGGDFRDHSAAYSFGPILDAHDPVAVEVFAYADEPFRDGHTKRLRGHVDHWRSIPEWPDDRVADLIRQDRIDVLVELSGYTHRHHLLACARKPAPVVVTAWGYLTGTGLDAVDAIFADDATLPPEHERQYAERAVRLPHALAFRAPETDVPIRPLPADAPPTFGYLGRIAKLSDAALALWSEILRAVPESRLLLKDRGFSERRPRERVLGALAALGVAPERVEIRGASGRETHLAVYNEVDVALDPVPQGGGMTTLEALWMGTPTATMLGDRVPGRMSASHLLRLGTGGAVTTDAEGYVREAVRLVGEARTLDGVRLRRALLDSVIADPVRQARAAEAAYRDLFTEWARGR
jgi:predicted O-linked N-acetylglucosamine transferase (SPINDLY family)